MVKNFKKTLISVFLFFYYLVVNGTSAKKRALLMASESLRWCKEQTPVLRFLVIIPCGVMNFLSITESLKSTTLILAAQK